MGRERDEGPSTPHTEQHITSDEELGDRDPEEAASSARVRRNLQGAEEAWDELRSGGARSDERPDTEGSNDTDDADGTGEPSETRQ